jgi:DNA-binding transcriptional MerR regulator
MLIGEFCRATGLGRDTVRFYIRRGLLKPERGHGPGNDYQVFSAGQVQRVRLIRAAQSLGFTLKEIAALAEAYERDDMTREARSALLRERVAALDEQAQRLNDMRAYLIAKIQWLEGGESGPAPAALPSRRGMGKNKPQGAQI